MGVLAQSVDLVREAGVDVDQPVDNQRTTFVTTEHTGREGPLRLNVLRIVLVNLGQRAEAAAKIIATPSRPVSRVTGQLFYFGISKTDARGGQSGRNGRGQQQTLQRVLHRLSSSDKAKIRLQTLIYT